MTASTTAQPGAYAGQNLFTDSIARFFQAVGSVKGRRVLVLGDNIVVFVRQLLARGASVEVMTALEQARQRISRHFPEMTVLLRDANMAQTISSRPRYDLVIFWDGFGPHLEGWVLLTHTVSDQVWADTMDRGWQRMLPPPQPQEGRRPPPPPPPQTYEFFPDTALRAARNRPADQVTDPLLVHVHLPKNGGSSFNDLLFENFGHRFVPVYAGDPFELQKADFFEQKVPEMPHALVIASHNFVEFPARVQRRPMLYVTFLRHSIERHLSFYRYAKKHYHNLGPEQIRALPANFLEITPQDYLRFEAGVVAAGYPMGQIRSFDAEGRLEPAREVLEGFFMVGVVEQLDRGIALLRKKLSAVGLHMVDMSAGHTNTTEELYDQTGSVQEDPETLEAASYLKEDLALYHWAKRRFERECVMYGV